MNWASEMETTYIKIWGFAINKKDKSLFLHSVFSSRLSLINLTYLAEHLARYQHKVMHLDELQR